MSGLSGLVLGLAKSRIGYNQGEAQAEAVKRAQEKQAQEMAMKQALLEFQTKPKSETVNWQTQETPNGIVQVNPQTGEVRPLQVGGKPLAGKPQTPVPGSPDWVKMKEQEAQISHKFDAPRRDPVADQIAVKQWERAHPAPQSDPADKPPSESERRAAGLLQQMYRSAEVVKNYQPKLGQIASKVGVIGNYALKHDPATQAAVQAGTQLYRSYLYTVSGATVNPDEAEQAARTYLPQPGDSPEVIAQKKSSIDDMLHTVETMAGRAKPTQGATPNLVPNDRAKALKAKYGIR